MIDFTTIQTYEVLPQLSELNAENITLKNQNQLFKVVFTSLIILIIGSSIYIISKNNQIDERN